VKEDSVAGERLKIGKRDSKGLQSQWSRTLRKAIDQKYLAKWRRNYFPLDLRNE
jgi:hypothetical protein